jgi:hydroxyethylthiazole kinase-like uncharacterized protein yjeF
MHSSSDSPAIRRADGIEVHRRLETDAVRRLGLGPETLMERAGEAARASLRRRWPWVRSLLVLAGTGNNGGDGYVLARRMLETGGEAIVLAWGEPSREPARTAHDRYVGAGGRVVLRAEISRFLASWTAWSETVLADALFGIGLSRALDRETAKLLLELNERNLEVLSLDIPSGLDAGSGRPRPLALRARRTLAFITPTPGHFLGEAGRFVGELEVASLGLDPLLAEIPPAIRILALEDPGSLIPERPPDAHKGLGGHVLVAGGDLGYGGAVRLSGEAALRSGAGLVSVVTRPEHVAGLLAGCPSLMAHGLLRPTRTALARIPASVLALGPGLGRTAWGHTLWRLLVRDPRPLVLDADGLNLLAEEPFRRSGWILTPHPGEAARLLGVKTEDVQDDRLAAARALVDRYDATVVLKGSGTIVAQRERIALAPYALPALATAGTGDLLTGIVAGLLARGLDSWDAACAGVLLHLRAGRRAARGRSWGILSQDLLPHLGP